MVVRPVGIAFAPYSVFGEPHGDGHRAGMGWLTSRCRCMVDRDVPPSVTFLAAMVVGLAGGLLYGLVLQPIKYHNVDPVYLSPQQKRDYVRLIAAAYAQDGDLSAAHARLERIGYGGAEVEREAVSAMLAGAPSAVALVHLSVALGYDRPAFSRLLATASPAATSPPRATMLSATPSIRTTATHTPRSSSATPGPRRTETVARTPIPPTPTRTGRAATGAAQPARRLATSLAGGDPRRP